jgi:hypothetical protein
MWGAAGHHKAHKLERQLNEEHAQRAHETELAAQNTHLLQLAAAKAKETHDAEVQAISTRLNIALRELHNRSERMPTASTTACQGVSGAELSRPDAEFLTRLSARADSLRAALIECQSWVESVGGK